MSRPVIAEAVLGASGYGMAISFTGLRPVGFWMVWFPIHTFLLLFVSVRLFSPHLKAESTQGLTLAVSRRALNGTRRPQSYHWRGRLHCVVRRHLYEESATQGAAS